MKCSKCGKELPEDALYCNKCGSKVEEMIEETSNEESSTYSTNRNIKESITEQPASNVVIESESVSEPAKKKDNKIIYTLLAICALILCIKGYTAYLNNKARATFEKYAQETYGYPGINNSSNNSTNFNSFSSIQKEMEEMANEYDKELPVDMGSGMTMKSCKMEGKNLVYSIEWRGMKADDFTSDIVADIKSYAIEDIKEENNPIFKALVSRISEYGYKIVYRYINENGDQLFNVSISSDDL